MEIRLLHLDTYIEMSFKSLIRDYNYIVYLGDRNVWLEQEVVLTFAKLMRLFKCILLPSFLWHLLFWDGQYDKVHAISYMLYCADNT